MPRQVFTSADCKSCFGDSTSVKRQVKTFLHSLNLPSTALWRQKQHVQPCHVSCAMKSYHIVIESYLTWSNHLHNPFDFTIFFARKCRLFRSIGMPKKHRPQARLVAPSIDYGNCEATLPSPVVIVLFVGHQDHSQGQGLKNLCSLSSFGLRFENKFMILSFISIYVFFLLMLFYVYKATWACW